jgi:hypothetical protein
MPASTEEPKKPLPVNGKTVMKRRPLTERERRFVEAYMGAAAGNATKAAHLAGYAKNTAEKQASRLLGKVGIREAIDARASSDPAVWTREQRQRFWTAIASGAGNYALASLRDRLKASELLGRSHADFVDRHQLEDGNGIGVIAKLLAARFDEHETKK